ncbi:hypothetical protein [Staphylococcus caprae]|uniref:hypothetical protein n=1 Tax=Staphylococcus caprae TaxID=29380 RepID=UPI003B228960
MRRWLKDNSNTLAQMIILASVLFVFLGPLGAGLGAAIGLAIGTPLDKNKKSVIAIMPRKFIEH